MAPVPITDDYYMVLEVVQTATPEQVVQSYKRLALKLHPDRNASHNSTEAFQLLGKAYETLKDESKRRAYDLIYPSIRRSRPSPQATQTPRTQKSESLSEAAQITALQKSKQERETRWQTTKNSFVSSILKVQAEIQRLEQEIKNLDSIVAAEAAIKAQENSWGTWLLSPIYKKVEASEEEKDRKDRERQERRIEKDMKERRLELRSTDLKSKETLLRKAKEEVDTQNLADERKIQETDIKYGSEKIGENKRERVERERMEKERMEKERVEREREGERMAKIWKQQKQQREKREREAAEVLRKREREAAETLKKQKEEEKKRKELFEDQIRKYCEQVDHPRSFLHHENSRNSASTCRHEGWWPKIQGRKSCPDCSEVWPYLLQCPGCKMKACPRCRFEIRQKRKQNTA